MKMTAATWIKSTSATMWVRVLAMFVVLAVGGVAMAQSVVVFVNGDPVTAIDIDQRTKFHVMTGQKASSRQKVLDELIDEILKVREGKRWGMEISNEDVDSSFTRMARGMGKSPSELSQFLAQKGTGAGTLKPLFGEIEDHRQGGYLHAGRQGIRKHGRLRVHPSTNPLPGAAGRPGSHL
jgi:hypothetical protein